MKVWLENRVDMEREVDARKIVKNFIEWDKKEELYYPIERRMSIFLSEYRIEGKKFVWDMDGFRELIDLYFEMRGD